VPTPGAIAVPFLPRPKVGSQLGQKGAYSIGWLTGFLLFALYATTYSYVQHGRTFLMFFSGLGFVFSGWYGYPTADPRLRRTMWRWFPLSVTSLSVVFGTVLGEVNYRNHMVHYLTIQNGSVYTNVIPLNPASGYRD